MLGLGLGFRVRAMVNLTLTVTLTITNTNPIAGRLDIMRRIRFWTFSKYQKPSFQAFYSIFHMIVRVSAGFVGLLGSVSEFFVTAL